MKMAETPVKQSHLSIGTRSPNCLQLKPSDEVALTLDISNKFLRQMYSQTGKGDSYVDYLNRNMKHMQLSKTDRLETRLCNEGSRLATEYKKIKSGTKRQKFDQKLRKIAILENETQSPAHTVSGNMALGLDHDSEKENSPSHFANKGVRIDNCSKTNKNKVVRTVAGSVGKALDFVETYGLLPKKLVCETFDGENCNVNLDGRRKSKIYENMPGSEKQELRKILHVCDSNMVSDSAYHELSMHCEQMPRKHLLISCRNDINTQFNIKRTPGLLPGSYLSLATEVKKDIESTEFPQNMKIKISGDGAKVSKIANFIVISYSHLNESQNLSHINQRVLAIVKCGENYENLDKSCRPIFNEINELRKAGHIDVGQKQYNLEFFVGGDMKFLQILLGLNSSIAVYACPWCKVSKDERGDISFPFDYYHSNARARSTQELKSLASSTAKIKYGVKHAPLLEIEPNHFVPDELHLMLRIMDVLLRNVIDDAVSKDNFAKITGQPTDNVSLLVKAIQSCGVSFSIWQSKSGELEWTSLAGNDMKKLLVNLPDKLLFCIHAETQQAVTGLWKDFLVIYQKITSKVINEKGQEIFQEIHNFMTNFLSLGQKKREGYHPKNITPYMHCLLYHVPVFLDNYGSLSAFSGQGVEKTNDIVKRIHHGKTNKLDATSDALLVRKRLELGYTDKMFREKRKYEKTDDDFWGRRKSVLQQAKKQRLEFEQTEAEKEFKSQSENNTPLDSLSVQELKKRLAEAGIMTKLRKKEKLVELLKNAKLN